MFFLKHHFLGKNEMSFSFDWDESKDLLKIINVNLALTIDSSFTCSWG